VWISGILDDLGMLPVQDIPQPLKAAREVLSVVDLVLKRWPQVPVRGTEFWTAAMPVTSGHPPRRSFGSSFFILLLKTTLGPHVPTHSELGPRGLG
jgi:hypothetical protein